MKHSVPRNYETQKTGKDFSGTKDALIDATASIPKLRAFYPLTLILRFPIIALITAVATSLLPVSAAAANHSLYNKKTAKKVDASKHALLGPRASRYRYDARLLRAAEIAAARARSHSRGVCWRSVKDALMSAELVDSRPKTAYAKQAAEELTTNHGFKKIRCKDPYKAPVGSVLVYGGKGAGHIEFRTTTGFVSDFTSTKPSKRPLIGVFIK